MRPRTKLSYEYETFGGLLTQNLKRGFSTPAFGIDTAMMYADGHIAPPSQRTRRRRRRLRSRTACQRRRSPRQFPGRDFPGTRPPPLGRFLAVQSALHLMNLKFESGPPGRLSRRSGCKWREARRVLQRRAGRAHHVIHHIAYRCSPRNPPRGVAVFATSGHVITHKSFV
jgi:hypothetical protein